MFGRKGYDTEIDKQWYATEPNVYVDNELSDCISSSAAREYIKSKKFHDLFGQLPMQVITYVLEKKLYT